MPETNYESFIEAALINHAEAIENHLWSLAIDIERGVANVDEEAADYLWRKRMRATPAYLFA